MPVCAIPDCRRTERKTDSSAFSAISALKDCVPLFVKYRHRSDGRPRPFSYFQRESNKSESFADHLVEIAQILDVRDRPFSTHAVRRVRLVVPHVGTSGIDPEI